MPASLQSLNAVQIIVGLLFMMIMIALICTMCKRGGSRGGGHGGGAAHAAPPAGGGAPPAAGGGGHGGGHGGGGRRRSGLIKWLVIFTFVPIFYVALTLSFQGSGMTLQVNDIKTVQQRAESIRSMMSGTVDKVRGFFRRLLEYKPLER